MSFWEELIQTGVAYNNHVTFARQAASAPPEQRGQLLTQYVRSLSDLGFTGFKATLLMMINDDDNDANTKSVCEGLLQFADAGRNGQLQSAGTPQLGSRPAPAQTDVDADVARINEWFSINNETDRKKAIVDHLLTMDAEQYAHYTENLKTIRGFQVQNISAHHEKEKYAWGRFLEDQIAYIAAKESTGAQDSTWKQGLKNLEQALGKVDWTIQTSAELWSAIQRAQANRKG